MCVEGQEDRVQWVQKVTEEIQVRREMMVTQDREEALASPETTVLQVAPETKVCADHLGQKARLELTAKMDVLEGREKKEAGEAQVPRESLEYQEGTAIEETTELTEKMAEEDQRAHRETLVPLDPPAPLVPRDILAPLDQWAHLAPQERLVNRDRMVQVDRRVRREKGAMWDPLEKQEYKEDKALLSPRETKDALDFKESKAIQVHLVPLVLVELLVHRVHMESEVNKVRQVHLETMVSPEAMVPLVPLANKETMVERGAKVTREHPDHLDLLVLLATVLDVLSAPLVNTSTLACLEMRRRSTDHQTTQQSLASILLSTMQILNQAVPTGWIQMVAASLMPLT